MAEQSHSGHERRGQDATLMQKATRWALRKAAAYAGVQLSLTDATGWRSLIGGTSNTGRAVNADTALQVSTVWSCVKILAESVAALPFAVFERQANGNAVKITDHAVAGLLGKMPNPVMTGMEFIEAGQVNLGIAGNCYSIVEKDNAGRPILLDPRPASQVRPERTPEGRIVYKINERGRWEEYPAERIWHIKGFGPTGLVGLSPLAVQREAMGLAMAAEEFGARMFSNGARTSGVVKIPQWLNPDQRKIAKENLTELYAGLENAHKLMLLEGGMEFDGNAAQIPPEDLQLLQLRQFQVHEICRIYRVPPHMVADLERATFSNIEQMSLEFVTYTLMPWLRRWETSIERWLLTPGERERLFVRFNVDGLLRADSDGRSKIYSVFLQNGVMNRNEARALENMNTVDGLDAYTVQSNMVPLDSLAVISQGASKPVNS
jgi:HK97 family phage portal protein